MNSQSADIQINLMKRSMRCFAFGALSLLPLAGIVFGPLALSLAGAIRRDEKTNWNAASNYRRLGTVLAAVGAILSGLLIGMIILRVGCPDFFRESSETRSFYYE